MSILQRIKRIARANINQLVDKAENPEKMLKEQIRELETAVREVKQALSDFGVTYKKNQKQQEQMKRVVAEWEHKAETAINTGDEELARKALGEKLKVNERIKQQAPSLEQSADTFNELRNNLAVLQDQLGGAKLRLSELQSRKNAASAQKAFAANFNRAASGDNDTAFDRMEQDVVQAECEAEIERDLQGGSTELDSNMERMSEELAVNAELEALKKRVKT